MTEIHMGQFVIWQLCGVRYLALRNIAGGWCWPEPVRRLPARSAP